MENNFKFAKGLFAGLVAGVAIGILLTQEKSTDIKDVLTGCLTNLKSSIKEIAAQGISKLYGLKKEIKSGVKFINTNEEQSYSDDLEHA